MSRVDVVGTGYAGAADILQDANQVAALRHQLFASDSHAYGAMAGDSSFADGFARAYDEGAAAVLVGLSEAVHALAVVGQMCFVSLENHSRAELASHLSAPQMWPTIEFDDARWYEAEPAEAPSALGGDLESLPGWASFILDHVEGFVWPDADLDRLRAAAADWHSHAEAVAHLASYPDRAASLLGQERSPEITQAVDVVSGIGRALEDISTQMHALGESCAGYADAVEAHREEILKLVHDLIRDALIIQGLGMILSTVTFGGGAAGAAGINAAKIAAETPRFMVILESLRAASLNYSVAMGSSASAVERVAAGLERFRSARIARGVVKDERGSFGFGGVSSTGGRRGSDFLREHEFPPGHVLRDHVGKTDEELLERLSRQPRLKYASTFTDERAAEIAIDGVLDANYGRILAWLRNPIGKLELNGLVARDVGKCMNRAGDLLDPTTVRVVLIRNEEMSEGFQILTAFPSV